MKARFFELAERLARELRAGETLLCNLSAERSDFVRFNKALVRQAGTVEQSYLSLRLVRARRQASATVSTLDLGEARAMIASLRDAIAGLPEDPWLLVSESPQSTSSERRGRVAAAQDVVEQAIAAAKGRDLVGFYAGGTIYRGFANSLGQRNWHEVDTFNFDWSLYLRGDQAVKTGYAGFDWDAQAFAARMEEAARQMEFLSLPRRTLEPGEYRAFVTPSAVNELTGMLCWGGFSARMRETKQSPLRRMEEGRTLAARVTITENIAGGIAPAFQSEGFVKPAQVALISSGKLGDALVSPRSAREYGLIPNGGSAETPDSLDMAAGDLPDADVLKALDKGLYISNLWYLNFSDRPAARITGMTRFATFWVENGRIAAPVTPMRFDDSVYSMLGDALVDLTRERDLFPETNTYGERQTSSSRVPGALLGKLRFTL